MGYLADVGSCQFGQAACNMRDIAAFIPFASVRYWSEVGGVRFKKYPVKRDLLDCFGY